MQDFEFSRTFFQLWEACNSARRAAIGGSHSWTKPPSGGGNVCKHGWSGVAAELAELALVNEVS